MKIRYLFLLIILLSLTGAISASAYMPDEGNFAFREVENYTLHHINFTVPTDYKLIDSGDDFLKFKFKKDTLKIKTDKNGKIKKVKSTKKVKANKTMLGPKKGYLVEKKKSYTFSYHEGKYLVVIKSRDLSLIVGVIGE